VKEKDMDDNYPAACAQHQAEKLWAACTEQEQAIIRFGMLPARLALEATEALKADGVTPRDAARLLAVAVFDCAKRAGKPLVV
jgi:hypothetical protein